ncbi:MAG: hypothetical protein WKF97_00300 [Chitinophagaceae bacterium]
MKNHILLAAALCMITFASCKKMISKQVHNYIVNLVTNGHWYLEEFIENGNNKTAEFAIYEFQFYENGRVDAIKVNATESGTWSGDIDTKTITVNFPLAADPLKKVNTAWKIRDSYVDVVMAESNSAGGLSTMRLRKK